MQEALTPTSLSNAAGISVPYASQIISGERQPSRDVAFAIFRATGKKFGHLAALNDRDARALVRLEAKVAAARASQPNAAPSQRTRKVAIRDNTQSNKPKGVAA